MLLVYLNVIFLLLMCHCDAAGIDVKVNNYFQNEDRRAMQDEWRKYKKGYETSLEKLLQENYDSKGMNVFKRRTHDIYKLSEGFLVVSDTVVDVVFRDLHLLELPRLRSPSVSFTLGSNVLKVDSETLKIKVLAKYIVYRNHSVITFVTGKETEKVSPFSLEQVQTSGEVTIMADECRLTGHAIATLVDKSVNLGHDTFGLTDCKFSLEIWTPGQGAPPVFTRYFDECDRNYLQNLISKPLKEELVTKLQGGLYSFVNTSEVFSDDLPKFRSRQEKIFKKVNQYMLKTVNNFNVLTTNKNRGVMRLEKKTFKWKEIIDNLDEEKDVSLTDMTLYGLDTAYTRHSGGPIELNGEMFIEETIAFGVLMVKGNIDFKHHKNQTVQKIRSAFSVEIQEFSVVIRMGLKNGVQAMNLDKSDMTKRSWYSPQIRNFELNLYEIGSIWGRSLVTGHILNELYSIVVMSILSGQLNKALQLTDNDKTGTIALYNDNVNKLSKTSKPGKGKNKCKDKTDSPKDKKVKNDENNEDDNIRLEGNTNIVKESIPAEENTNVYEESIVLWKNKDSENVSLVIGEDNVQIQEGNRTLFKSSRLDDNEINIL